MRIIKGVVLVAATGALLTAYAPHTSESEHRHEPIQFKREQTQSELVISYIRRAASSSQLPESLALSIAECESRFNPYATNPKSTASGVYQFTKGTWSSYCTGDVFDYRDNIDCFFKLYPRFPSWWECSP